MFGLGMWELIVILVIIVLLFGAKRLPEIGAGIGDGIKNFRKSMKDDKTDKTEKTDKTDKKEGT